jgi:hypothetical protein
MGAMTALRARVAVLAAVLLLCANATAAPETSPDEIRSRVRDRLRGRHFTAAVRLEIERESGRELRKLRTWRDDVDGNERFLARFDHPPDMRGLGLLYLERTDGPNDYFLYQPAVQRVRRVPETMVRQDVYGVDLEYLGFGVTQLEPAKIVSVDLDTLGDRPVYRIVEEATHDNQRFDRRTLFVDRFHYALLRAVHERQGRIQLEATTLELREVDGIATPFAARFERPQEREVVHMFVDEVDYRSPSPEAYFSTLKLIRGR